MRLLFLLLSLGLVAAENGLDAWLRYAPLPVAPHNLPSSIVTLNSTIGGPVQVAGVELQKGLKGIFSKAVDVTAPSQKLPPSSAKIGSPAVKKQARRLMSDSLATDEGVKGKYIEQSVDIRSDIDPISLTTNWANLKAHWQNLEMERNEVDADEMEIDKKIEVE